MVLRRLMVLRRPMVHRRPMVLMDVVMECRHSKVEWARMLMVLMVLMVLRRPMVLRHPMELRRPMVQKVQLDVVQGRHHLKEGWVRQLRV